MRHLATPALAALLGLAPLAGLVGFAAPMAAQQTTTPPTVIGEDAPRVDGRDRVDGRIDAAHVRVTARIIVVDREAFTRAGLAYAVLGNDRVRVSSTARGGVRGGGGSARGARIGVGTHGVAAFLEAVRESRWVRSESTQQVLTMSGGEGVVSSTDLAVGRRAARTRGPSLVVSPSVLDDGSVHLRVSARVEDSVRYAWGYGVDGSPAAVDAEIIARDGEEVILASSSAVQTTRESGLLRWGSGEQGRDVLVAVTARVVHH